METENAIIFKPDERWSIFFGCKTFEGFCQTQIPTFEIGECVPEPIRRRLILTQELIRHAYFQYEFLDLALESIYLTLEFSLHLKYEELNPGKKKKNLKPYLDWAVKNNILRLSKDQFVNLADLRNHQLHRKSDNLNGIASLNMIRFIGVDIMKQLFKK